MVTPKYVEFGISSRVCSMSVWNLVSGLVDLEILMMYSTKCIEVHSPGAGLFFQECQVLLQLLLVLCGLNMPV